MKSLIDMPYFIEEWPNKEKIHYNHNAFKIYNSSKYFDIVNSINDDIDYNKIYQFEDLDEELVFVLERYSNSFKFKKMLDNNDIKYKEYPFD